MCKEGQNKIDYIVYHNPSASADLLSSFGYEPPKKVVDLAVAVKQLIRKKGEPVIKELLMIHPERRVLLEMTGHNPDANESNFCGCQSSYTGELKDYTSTKLSEVSDQDLADLYEDAKRQSKTSPTDKMLMAQVESIWDELKRRKKGKEQKAYSGGEDSEKRLLYLAVAFLAGVVLAKLS